MDKKGALNPAEDADMQIGLRVIVDSEVPKIELRPIARDGQEVGVEWEVQDRNIDLESLKMEYRVDGQESWRAVPGVVQKFFGQAVWAPEAAGRITVRCQVQDRAHNLGIQSIEIETNAAATATEQPTETIGTIGQQESGMKPFNVQPDIPVNRPSLNTMNQGPASKRSSTSRPVTVDTKVDAVGTEPSSAAGSDESGLGTGAGRRSSTRYDFDSIEPANPKRTATQPATKPANRQIVNDTEVSLDYQIDDEGPSGVSVIELWATTDMGRTWRRVGEDSDRESPFIVNFAGDGLYGLTMVAKSGVGLGDRPPSAGDQPQMWIEVDKTPPQIQLNSPEVGKGPQAGSVIITWQAEDQNLADRCVTIYYAEGTSNDWKTIVTGVDNSGRYVWKLNGQVPFRFRVAVEIADMAGNREMSESAEVTIDMSKPKPRISGVSPGKTIR
jgi:hypothetical protein